MKKTLLIMQGLLISLMLDADFLDASCVSCEASTASSEIAESSGDSSGSSDQKPARQNSPSGSANPEDYRNIPRSNRGQ